jgi:DNA-binding LacI/PurR family transcriptional regulator
MVVRLSDVAARAGVSVKTVSNVVHGYTHVRPDTRAKVQAALDELHYRPNLTARSLRRGRTGVIALAVPTLAVPYFAELAGAVVTAASDRGWTVLVDQTDGLRERELEVARGLGGRLIDGLVLSPMALDENDLEHTSEDVPLVLLGERVVTGPVDHVAVDNVAAARDATRHLLAGGRRRVAALGYQDRAHAASGVAALRRRGYEAALAEAGVPPDVTLTPPVDGYDRSNGRAGMERLLALDEPPDAVFCFNDLLAFGAMRALADGGLSAPDDMAVMGFDDVEEGRFSVPSLSTVAPDRGALARTAVDMLAERMAEHEQIPARDVRIGYQVVPRESTLGTREKG